MKTTIELAREAGGRAQANQNCDDEYLMSVEQLEAFEALVRAMRENAYVQAEREACAKVIEEYPHWLGMTAKAEIANAIRNRGNT
jgi:hypothetical protein